MFHTRTAIPGPNRPMAGATPFSASALRTSATTRKIGWPTRQTRVNNPTAMLSRKSPKNNAYPAVVAQCFEAKYRINAAQAMAVRELIRPYMDADPHGSAYPVTSIYLDSPDLAMYWSSARGEERRHK